MDKDRLGHDDVWAEKKLALLGPGGVWEPNPAVGLTMLKREMQRTKAQFRKRVTWLSVIVGVACLCVVIFPLPRVLAHRCLECTVAVLQSLAQVDPQPANLKPEGGRKLAPDFDLKDAQGKNLQLSALKGRVVLVNFWATWCHGCQEEIPSFIEFEKKYEKRGLTIVGVSMDDDGWKSVAPWIKQKSVNYPIVIGNNDLSQRYGLVGMPLSVLVDRKGRIANRQDGVVNAAAFEQQIRGLLGEDGKDSIN
jgi:thiol-disulfide isomerase/thioredoxin